MSIVGFGRLFELYSRFLMEHFWALLFVICLAFALNEALAWLERRVELLRRLPDLNRRCKRHHAVGGVRDHPATAALPQGQGHRCRFPVHRVYCVGRNYAAHAIEMGGNPDREPPFFFQKNPDNLVIDDGVFPYPGRSDDVHHEIEMVVALANGGRDIPLDRALACVFGYGVGLDMTRRRPAGRVQEAWAALGGRQGLREVGTMLGAGARGRNRPPGEVIWLEVNGEGARRTSTS